MSNLTILRRYAQQAPSALPNSVLFQSSTKFLTIFDAFPKSIFHFLILPRIVETDAAPVSQQAEMSNEGAEGNSFTISELRNLKALLRTDKARSKQLIEDMRLEAEEIKKQVEEEMIERYGMKWDVWIGFHSVPSMEHLHLHVLSADLVSERMKNKKHYNSFHPTLGFFLHIKDVLEWFDATPEYFNQVSALNPKPYEDLLKGPLQCFKCGSTTKNMPALKEHLQGEWDNMAARAHRRGAAVKRKKEEQSAESLTVKEVTEDDKEPRDSESIPSKKAKVDSSSSIVQ